MQDHLISMFIDDELDLDNKIEFIETVHADRVYKDETVDFKLVKIEENKVFFEGFTIEKVGDDEITMYVLIGEKGKAEEVVFNYRRLD